MRKTLAMLSDLLRRRDRKLRDDSAEEAALFLKSRRQHFSGHRLNSDSAQANWLNIDDPGNGGTVQPKGMGVYGQCKLVIGTTAETRTLPDPERAGLELVLTAYSVGSGGSCVLTANSKIDQVGDTKLTFNAADQSAYLMSVPYAGNTNKARWECWEADQALLGPGQSFGGTKRLTATVSKTSNNTLAQVSDLTFSNLVAGQTYVFSACLLITCGATGGAAIAVGGTATATAVNFQASLTDGSNTALGVSSQVSALATSVTFANTGCLVQNGYIDGVITVNAAGTFGVQFAQKTSNGTASVLGLGSYITLTPVA